MNESQLNAFQVASVSLAIFFAAVQALLPDYDRD